MSPLFGVGFWDVPSDVCPTLTTAYGADYRFGDAECLSELFVVPGAVVVDHDCVRINEVGSHSFVGVPVESVVNGRVVSQVSGIETTRVASNRVADLHSFRARTENQSGGKHMNALGPSRNVHLPVPVGCAERPQCAFITERPVFEASDDFFECGWGLTSFSSHEFMISQGDV